MLLVLNHVKATLRSAASVLRSKHGNRTGTSQAPSDSRARYRTGGWKDIVEPFGSDFTLEPIDELSDGPRQAQESAFALGEFGFDFFRRRIDAIDEACDRVGAMSACGKLVLEALRDVQEYARALKAKIVLECGK